MSNGFCARIYGGGAMVLCKLPVPGRPNQGPTALAVGAGGGCLDIFLSSVISFLSPSLWETTDIDCNTVSKGR